MARSHGTSTRQPSNVYAVCDENGFRLVLDEPDVPEPEPETREVVEWRDVDIPTWYDRDPLGLHVTDDDWNEDEYPDEKYCLPATKPTSRRFRQANSHDN